MFLITGIACLRSAINLELVEKREEASEALRKIYFGGNEAHDKIPILREIEEMAGMDVNVLVVEQGEREIFIGARGRDAQDRVPAAFHSEVAANRLRGELAVEFREISLDAREELRLETVALR